MSSVFSTKRYVSCLLALSTSMMLASAALAQAPAAPSAPSKPATPAATPAAPATPAKPASPAAEMPEDKPGPMHEWLKHFEGEWSCVTKEFDPMSGKEAGGGTGTMTTKLAMGGRFLVNEYDGRWDGKFFRGMGTTGYNNALKRFESTWVDSMGTQTMFMTGTADAAGKVLTCTGDMIDPMSGQKITMKEVTTITAKDAHRQDFYITMNGKELKVMEIVSTKGKAAKKDEMKKEDGKKEEMKKEEGKKDEPKKDAPKK